MTAPPFVPDSTSVRTLSAAAQECRGCDLYQRATQVVFGAGPRGAGVMFVGEQPDDQEDRQIATIHASAVRRAPDPEGRRRAYDSLVADLRVVARTRTSNRGPAP